MVQWPPSPVVEDETTALAKECSLGTVSQTAATEDYSVPSRGSVDQYPILCESKTQTETLPQKAGIDMASKSSQAGPSQAEPLLKPLPPKRERVSYITPTLDSELRGRASNAGKEADRSTPSAPRSQSASWVGDAPDSRFKPSISRIQTDVAGELLSMKAGTRRAPSPYSYTREPAKDRPDPLVRSATDHFLSPTHAVESPVSNRRPQSRQEIHGGSKDHDSSTDSEKKLKKTLRFADKPLGPTPSAPPRKSFSLPESRSGEQEPIDTKASQPDIDQTSKYRKHRHPHHSHDDHRERGNNATSDSEPDSQVLKRRSSRPSSKVRDLPVPSSPEDLVKLRQPKDSKDSIPDETLVQSRPSHRHERPRLGSFNQDMAHARKASTDDDPLRRVYRVRESRTPMTPPSVTTPKHMEDYFSEAFRDNALKHSRYTPRLSVDETAVFSPPTSPPRTPKSERRGRVEYFESPSSSPHRTPTSSRPPSLEESQIRDLKAHHSLLSQATAGAAAVAARVSPPTSRTPSTIDAALNNPNHVVVTKSRSRVSSPTRQPLPQSSFVDTSSASRSISRASSPQSEAIRPIIHRAESSSYAGHTSRPPSPSKETAKSAVRSDSSPYVPPRSRASSPQRESLRPIVHRADTYTYSQPRSRATSPQREPLKPAIRTDSVTRDKPRSRASSPQRETPKPIMRADSWSNIQSNPKRTYFSPGPQAKRPSTRDGLPMADLLSQPPPVQPQRTASFTSFEHQRPYVPHLPGPLHVMTAMSAAAPSSSLKVPPPLLRSQSASTPAEISQKVEDFALPPCPRFQPTQGLRDWLTIRGVPNVDICPKCAHALVATRYRAALVRSPDKPYNRNTVCAMSRPWVRIAVTQCIKRNRTDLSLVRDANTLAMGARPCEGTHLDVRQWWRVPDSLTDRAVPNFLACSACIGSVHAVYPELEHAFTRDALNQEGVCSLRCTSNEFYMYAEQLEKIAEKCRDRGQCKPKYLQPLVAAIKRFSTPRNYAECPRDRMLTARPWHFMDALPEFTVCDACFEEVVYPVVDKPYARDISRALQIVPASTYKGTDPAAAASGGLHPTSCQLYSDRMRRYFNDVVSGRVSWETFKNKVKERQAAQYRMIDMSRILAEDQKRGWDRRGDIERNWAYWKNLE